MTKKNKAIKNMDKNRSRLIGSLPEEFILTKRIKAAMHPWSIEKMKKVLRGKHILSLEKGHEEILGVKTSKKVIIELFQLSSSYKRLAENNYEDKPQELL